MKKKFKIGDVVTIVNKEKLKPSEDGKGFKCTITGMHVSATMMDVEKENRVIRSVDYHEKYGDI